MTASTKPLTKRPAWKAFAAHYKKIQGLQLANLFADDSKRGQRLTCEAVGLFLDYSKNRITDETIKLLLQLAEESDLRGRIDAMFSGEKINITEKRAVLHVALRAPKDASIIVDGKNVVPEVHAVLDAMTAFAETGPQRRLERSHRQTHPQYRKHWHRWLRPRTGHGVRGSSPLQ